MAEQEWHTGRIFKHEELEGWTQDHVAFRCPVCDFEYTHFGKPSLRQTDDYDVWNGRGGALRVPMYCEAGHAWNLGIGFHKGISVLFWERNTEREALMAEGGLDG